MNRLNKFKALDAAPVDASVDIDLINQHSIKKLTPEEVFCFSVILCDNEVDRDYERFTDSCLDALAPLFVGKTGISDHYWSVEKQVARLYRVEAEDTGERNSLGEDLRVLRGSAYMLRNEATQPMIDAVEGGIVKEVSVGLMVGKSACSICGEPMRWGKCEAGHSKCGEYDGKTCYAELSEPSDAFEFSFVAVPAQRGAGVTKDAKEDVERAIDALMDETHISYYESIPALIKKLQMSMLDEDERRARADIIAENEAYLAK